MILSRWRNEKWGNLNEAYEDFWKDLCKRDDFLREVIGAIQLRCTALPHLRARHERRTMTE